MAGMSRALLIVVIVLCWSLAGCSMKQYMVKSMDPIMEDMNLSVNRNPDVEMVRDAFPASLIQLDGFITSAPNDKLLVRAAEANFGYAYSFVEDNNRERASFLYLKARDYALRPLMKNKAFRENYNQTPDKFKESLAGFGKADVPALYWTANNWMAWAGLNVNNPEVLVDIAKIEAMLLKIVELDETYYYGGAHAALGAYYASRAKTIGGDPDKAKAHFERAFTVSNSKMLFFQVLYAQYYAYQIQDRDLFEKTLQDVISKPVDYFPDKNFANEAAKRKARVLLEDIDTYF